VPWAYLKVGVAGAILGKKTIREELDHLRVICPPQLGDQERVHVAPHEFVIRVHFSDRVLESRQSVGASSFEVEPFLVQVTAEPSIVTGKFARRVAKLLDRGGYLLRERRRPVCKSRGEILVVLGPNLELSANEPIEGGAGVGSGEEGHQ
jgi:hypothetical protein